MRAALAAVALCASVAGCNAAGEPGGDSRWSHAGVPFTFVYPADFTKAPIDQANTRGDVVGAVGVTKVDVIAVRRFMSYTSVSGRHRTLGRAVTSELHPVPGFSGWSFECQYTPEQRAKILNACRLALRSVSGH